MKRIVVIIIVLTSLALVWSFIRSPKLNSENVSELILIKLPSPPMSKVVESKEDIARCMDYINNIEKTPTLDSGKGWWFMIKIDGHSTITFSEDRMKINSRNYKIKTKDYTETLLALYDSIKIPEDYWGK